MSKAVSYIEIDIPFCANTYGVAPCTASLSSSPPTGTRKCFNTPNTCQDRVNYIDAPVTLRFSLDNGLHQEAKIPCIPSIDQITFTPAVVSLGKDLGQRASLSVRFHDHPWPDTGPGFDPYLSERPYNPFLRGTFWGKFRARQPFLRGRAIRLIRGFVGQSLVEMDTRHYVIDSFTHSAEDGSYELVGKDLLKFTDDDRAQAPKVSQGFIVTDIADNATSLQLSPSGIGNEEYPVSGYATLGGKEIVFFTRDPVPGNDANTKLLIHCDGANAATDFVDSSSSGKTVSVTSAAQKTTSQKRFGTASALFDGIDDELTLADSEDWTFSGNFTVDMWVRPTSISAEHTIFQHATDDNNNYRLKITSTGALDFTIRSGGSNLLNLVSSAGVLTAGGDFYHVAVMRTGNVWNITVNGVSVATTTAAVTIPNYTSNFRIGGDQSFNREFAGQMDEIRVSHVARWSVPFTPPVSAYQTSSDILTITRAQFTTEAQSHGASDRVQLVLKYDAEDVADILYDLLVNYADVDPSYIPLVAWKDETAAFLDRVFTAIIAEPVGVQTLINELIEDAALVIWWDDVTPQLELRVLRQVSSDAFEFNQDNYMAGTFSSKEQPNERLSQIWRFFAKRNPVERQDNEDNYRSVAVTIDLEAETDYGSKVIHKFFSRWIPFGGRSIADKANDLYLSRYRDPPRAFQFSVFRNGLITPELGLGYRLAAMGLQDDTGEPISTPIQITRLNPSDTQFDIEGQEMLLFGDPADLINRVIVIDSNSYNINLRTLHDTLYPAPTAQDVIDGVTLTCIIDAGALVGSSVVNSRSFDVGTGWPVGFPITIINRGGIRGLGGEGGKPNGSAGGIALYTRFPINLELPVGSTLWGGGGGGGRGAVRGVGGSFVCGCGGGGGAGFNPGLGSPGITCNGNKSDDGDPGTQSSGGAGGSGGGTNSGGNGGGPGLAGQNGNNSGGGNLIRPFGTGGAAGSSIDGVSFVTITVNLGDVRGPQVN